MEQISVKAGLNTFQVRQLCEENGIEYSYDKFVKLKHIVKLSGSTHVGMQKCLEIFVGEIISDLWGEENGRQQEKA